MRLRAGAPHSTPARFPRKEKDGSGARTEAATLHGTAHWKLETGNWKREEQVVEVVRDAPGQLADPFDLLRLQQLCLELRASWLCDSAHRQW